MKKALIIILCFLLAFVCLLNSCNSTNPPNSTDPSNEAVKEEKYQNVLSLIKGGNYAEAYKLIGELGDYKDAKKELAKFHYVPTKMNYEDNNEDGELEKYMTKVITYNEQNLPTQVVCHYVDDYKEIYDYTYDASGNLIKAVYTFPDNYAICEYTYDVNGNIIKQATTNSNGSKYTSDYTYDANGNCIKMVDIKHNDLADIYGYTYDTNGNLIKEVVTYPDGSNNVIEYTYDTKGNPIKKVETHPYSDDKYVTDYIYDANGNCIKKIRTEDGGSEDIYDYTYDASKNCIKEIHTDSSGNMVVYDYTYDANGNLIKYEATYSYSDFDDKSMIEIEYMLVYIDREFSNEEWEEFLEMTLYS